MNESSQPEPRPQRFQFGVSKLLLATLLVAIPAALLGGAGANNLKAGDMPGVIILLVSAPMGIMVVFSMGFTLWYWWKRRN